MNDTVSAGGSSPEEGGRGPLDSGLQVGLAGSGPGAAAGAGRAPSWVVPMIVLALVAGLGVGLAVGLLVGNNDGSGQAATTTTTTAWDPADAYGATIAATGDALPMLSMSSDQPDTALGLPLPGIAGTDYAGNPLAIAADGRPKLIVALAHWCPYCNAMIPILEEWYAAGLPEGLEVVSLSVYANSTRANFPPASWLAAAGWSLPLIADDAAGTLAATLGIPAVPYWLLVSADGTVLARTTGQRDAAFLDGAVAALTGAATTTTVP